VLAGPPPRALPRLDVVIKEEDVYVREMDEHHDAKI
jgi:hypothetical protein